MSAVYMDYNATATVRPEAIQAVTEALAAGGNPSSVHAAGRAARARIEVAREQIGSLVGAPAAGVVFLSGGTEANGLTLESAVAAGARRLIVSAIEHPSVLDGAHASGAIVELLPVGAGGVADLAWLESRLAKWDDADGPPFVALMLANNETGAIQPIAAAAGLVHAAGGWLHVDAVQAAGKVAIDISALGADTMSLSAHKIGGPQGVGALVAGSRARLTRRQHGGGQERGYRGGTENAPGIAGFASAAEAARRDLDALGVQAAWRSSAVARLEGVGAVEIAATAPRLANTLCIATPNWPSELQVMALDLAQVMVSAGAACSSGKVKGSQVLAAMGLNDLAACAIRVSGGWATCEADWDRFADAWLEAHQNHVARRRATAA